MIRWQRTLLVMGLFTAGATPVAAQPPECPPLDAGCAQQLARDAREHRDWLEVQVALAKARLLEANQRIADLLRELSALKSPPEESK